MSARIEAAILAARVVAASAGAAELRRHSNGAAGTWDDGDEQRLREGWIRVWNPHGKRWERLDVGKATPADPDVRARLLECVAVTRAVVEGVRGGVAT